MTSRLSEQVQSVLTPYPVCLSVCLSMQSVCLSVCLLVSVCLSVWAGPVAQLKSFSTLSISPAFSPSQAVVSTSCGQWAGRYAPHLSAGHRGQSPAVLRRCTSAGGGRGRGGKSTMPRLPGRPSAAVESTAPQTPRLCR